MAKRKLGQCDNVYIGCRAQANENIRNNLSPHYKLSKNYDQ